MYKVSNYNIFLEINGKKHIYNSISKSFIQISDDFEINKILESINSNKNTYMDLIDNGFIIKEDHCEISKLNYIYNTTFFNSSNLNIIIMPTLNCNFSCPYCFENTDIKYKENKNYFKILKLFSKKYFKLYKHIEISLFGGEPLLVKDELFEYLNFVQKLSKNKNFSYSTSITTNGSLLDYLILDKLVYHNCKSLQITLDGSIYTHDKFRCYKNGKPSFEILLNIINTIIADKILLSNLNFILRINLNNNTLKEVEETLELIREDIRSKISLVMRPIYPTNKYSFCNLNTWEQMPKYYSIAEKLGFKVMKNRYKYRSCEACSNENFMYITPDLNVWKCVNNLNITEAKIGKINEDGEYLINSKNLFNWYNASNWMLDENCTKCKKLPDCLGGCILYKIVNKKRKCSPIELTSLPYYYE